MNKMIMRFRNKLGMTYLLPLIASLLLFSCADSVQEAVSSEVTASADGKTYLVLSAPAISAAKSIAPATSDYAVTALTNLMLTGSPTGGSAQTLATAETYSQINGKLIPVSAEGSWSFTLTATLNGATLTGTASKDIALGTTTSISFTLSADESYGGMSIKLTFSGTTTSKSDYRVVATLQNETKTETIEEKIFTADEITASSNSSSNKSFYVTYARSAAADGERRLAAGTYFLLFEIYDTRFSETVSLNTSRSFVRIDDGITTTAAFSLTLNDVYTITYTDNGGALASGEVKVLNYSRKSGTITLPQMTPADSGTFFAGWYTDASFTASSEIAEITSGTTGNLTLYARYCTPDVYVDGTNGAETGVNGLSSDSAFLTLDAALSAITSYELPLDWTIHIANTLYGNQELSAVLTESVATSLTLAGTTGDGSDTLSAREDATAPEGSGSVLTVSTSVPVTITNLTLTDGNATNGGGISIASGATVNLADGAVITGNNATNGGGVWVGGTFTMTGGSINNNTAVSGGGVNIPVGGTFTMTGGNIIGNTVSLGEGAAVLNEGSCSIGENTTIDMVNNDIIDAVVQ